MSGTVSIGLLGSSGRMGQWVQTLLQKEFTNRARLAAQAGSRSPYEPLLATDVVIDFSLPEAMHALAKIALAHPSKLPAFVVGSTGATPDQRRTLEELARKTPVLVASNFSIGVGALLKVLSYAAPLLKDLGYTPVLVETHHQHKKDAPSGTALTLARAIEPSAPERVQTHAIRAGEIIGDHEITFYGPGDHVTFGHFAQDRSIFARGAIEVALWLNTRRLHNPGHILEMKDFFDKS